MEQTHLRPGPLSVAVALAVAVMAMYSAPLAGQPVAAGSDPAAAADALGQEIGERTRELGPDHPDTLASQHSLAAVLSELGDKAGARDLFTRVSAARERSFGADHPDTLASRHRLAAVLRDLGDKAGARDLFTRVSDARERSLGADHPGTQESRLALAGVLISLGDYAGARGALAKAAGSLERTLGPEHPDTLRARNNLGYVLGQLGDHAAARELFAQVAGAYERTLGPGHQNTLAAKMNLTSELLALGDYLKYREVNAQILHARERTLGPDHPDTLEAKTNQAAILIQLEDFSEAGELNAQLLESCGRTLGPDHPQTLSAKNSLALNLSRLGDFDGAREMLSELLEARTRTLGPDHPQTLGAKSNLAGTLHYLGDRSGAREMLTQVIESMERTLGPDHPDTLRTKNGLAVVLNDLGDYAAARDTIRHVAEVRERTLGPGHPETLTANINLAEVLNPLGEHAAARALFIDVLEQATRLYGPDNRESARAAEGLGATFARSGEPDRAVFFLKLSVSAAQRTRGRIAGLGREQRRGYLSTVEIRYRMLIKLLLERGRTAEALAVLGLLKEEELVGLGAASRAGAVPAGDAAPGSLASAPLSGDPEAASEAGDAETAPLAGDEAADLFGGTTDAEAWRAYSGAASRSGALGAERAALEDSRDSGSLTGDGARRLEELNGLIGKAREDFLAFCAGENWPDEAPAGPEPGSWADAWLAERQAALSGTGGDATLLYAVSTSDALWLVAVTPGSVTARRSGIGRRELAALASEFRGLAASPSLDPREAGARLYDALIRPVEADLAAAGTRTLMLSLDGELRYAPVAALWDGKRWLMERWPISLFTESTPARLRDSPRAGEASVRAMGVTASWPGFAALPGVAAELAAVVRTPDTPLGALAGEARLDAAFDRAALAGGLSSGAPVVHVASHFRLDPMSLENTVLLLGDGNRLSLREIISGGDLDFRGLDLLTLSACDTASAARGGVGREVESLGEAVQRAGASAVLATLMPVDDRAAPELMREFYRLRYLEGKDKAEALRGAQLLVMGNLFSGASHEGSGATAAGAGAPGAVTPGAVTPPVPAPDARPAFGDGAGAGAPETGRLEAGRRGSVLNAGGAAAAASAAPAWEGTGFSHPCFWAPFVIMGSWR